MQNSPLIWASGAAVACALVGCDGGSKDQPAASGGAVSAAPLKISIQLDWMPEPEFGGLYAAKELGLFEKAGLEVAIVPGAPGVPGAQMVASGTCEIAVLSCDQILTTRAQGGDIVAIYATMETNPTAVMVHESNPAKTLKDVWTSGLTVMTEPGLPWVQLMNQKYGTAGVKIVPGTGGVTSFMADPMLAQSVFVTSEPLTMKVNKIPVRCINVAESGYDPYVAVYSTRADFLEKNLDALTRFANAMQEGWRAYLANPARFNAAIAPLNPAMGVDAMNDAAKILAPYVETDNGTPVTLGSMDPKRWESVANQLVSTGIMKGPVNWQAAYRNLVTTPAR